MWASLVNFIAPEPTPEELLLSSLERGSCDLLNETLQQRGADAVAQIKVQGDLNLFQASCWVGNAEAALKLFELGLFDVNQQTVGGGNTAAHLAAMQGHQWLVVDYLVGQLGASIALRNAKRQNVYDACPATHLQLKQTLMTLLLQEEQRTGTAPELGIPVTRDKQVEEERMRNLPPPPIFTVPGGVPPPSQQQQHHIQPDGFVTTVGNPALAQKYGNVQVQTRLHTPQPMPSSPMAPPPPQQVIAPPPQQFAPARYVPVNINVVPASRPPPTAQFRPLATSGAKVFTPNQQQQQ
ncbi:hypothetical protein BASA81_002779 [Batrachochytrium salamandrivorans]|nr:hypothetical protein BASA81_002779 [Batrachochytrium salamandrivorans]